MLKPNDEHKIGAWQQFGFICYELLLFVLELYLVSYFTVINNTLFTQKSPRKFSGLA